MADEIEKDKGHVVIKQFAVKEPEDTKEKTESLYQISHLLNQYFVTKRKKILKQLSRAIKTHNGLINVPTLDQDTAELFNMFTVIKEICYQELIDLEEQVYETKTTN